jgi:hypothetical protein
VYEGRAACAAAIPPTVPARELVPLHHRSCWLGLSAGWSLALPTVGEGGAVLTTLTVGSAGACRAGSQC